MRSLVFLLFLLPGLAAQADETEALNKKLIQLRSQVDQLQNELDQTRQEHKATMASLTAQSGDLEIRKRRQGNEIQRLQKELAELQENIRQGGMDAENLTPVLLEAMQQAESRIRTGIPFKITERTQALQEIENKLQQGKVDAWSALQRFWAFQEDEMRLLHENGLYSQTIDLDGQQILVEIARLGGVMMFFRTSDQQYGYAQAGNEGWHFVRSEDAVEREQIINLFDSLQKQIRQGYFQLPTAAIPLARLSKGTQP